MGVAISRSLSQRIVHFLVFLGTSPKQLWYYSGVHVAAAKHMQAKHCIHLSRRQLKDSESVQEIGNWTAIQPLERQLLKPQIRWARFLSKYGSNARKTGSTSLQKHNLPSSWGFDALLVTGLHLLLKNRLWTIGFKLSGISILQLAGFYGGRSEPMGKPWQHMAVQRS